VGLISGLVTWPLAPVRGALWVAEQVEREAERQWFDPAAIERELDDVARRREAGELSGDEADALEDALVERLMHGASGHG
jgi:hypothetical protein